MASPDLLGVLRRSQALGFLGPGPVEAHVERAGAFVDAVPAGASIGSFLDLGSGGGVPGLVLALAWPAATATLLDSQQRRIVFLTEAVVELGLDDRVDVVHGRAEELAHDPTHRDAYDLVTARSFGPPALTAECAVGFLRPGGSLLVAEPPDEPPRWPEAGLRAMGLEHVGTTADHGATVARLELTGERPPSLPRRPAAMRRRPAF
jgi:16S rRNA (guanine527-N7)-methyltransferase